MIIGIGVDIIDIKRIDAAMQKRSLLERIYTKNEIALFEERKFNPQTIAGNFAAKEAVAKALGTGFDGVSWRDIEILREASGRPYAVLHATAHNVMEKCGGKSIFLSISNEKDYAVAQAILEG